MAIVLVLSMRWNTLNWSEREEAMSTRKYKFDIKIPMWQKEIGDFVRCRRNINISSALVIKKGTIGIIKHKNYIDSHEASYYVYDIEIADTHKLLTNQTDFEWE